MGGLRNVLSGFHRHSPRPHGSTPLATVSRRTACLGAQATRTRKCGHRVARPLRGRRGRATRRSASQGLARDDRGALVTEVSRADGLRVTNPTAALEMLTGGLGARVGRSGNDALRSMHAGAMSCTLRDLGRSREASPFAAESVELAKSRHGPESAIVLQGASCLFDDDCRSVCLSSTTTRNAHQSHAANDGSDTDGADHQGARASRAPARDGLACSKHKLLTL